MDKFGSRTKPEERGRRYRLFALVFAGVAAWFAALFAFGNAGVLWLIAIYVVVLVFIYRLQFQELMSAVRLWLQGVPIQSVQGPGFSPLEVEAIQSLAGQSSAVERSVRDHFRAAVVRARWNTGGGSLTFITSDTPQIIPDADLTFTPWFVVGQLVSPVGCRLWSRDGVVDVLEFFCGGDDTRRIDWVTATFSPNYEGPRPPTPSSRPLIDLDEVDLNLAGSTRQAASRRKTGSEYPSSR